MRKTLSIHPVKNYDMNSLEQEMADNAYSNELISNNGFFPDIDLLHVRNAMRIDGTVTNERLKQAVIDAMGTVNTELIPYRQKHQQNGISRLIDIHAEMINNESLICQRYQKAIYCMALASINERYINFDSKNESNNRVEELQTLINALRRDARFAIRDLLGKKHMTAELI